MSIAVFAAALVGAASTPGVDTIFLGGTILTMDDTRPQVEALAIVDGRIVALGAEEELRPLAGRETRIINLRGRTLMPGLIEAHCHPIATATLGQVLDVSGFTHDSRAEVIATLRAAVTKKSSGDWLFTFGWDPVMIADLEKPTLAELDELAPDVPVLILTQMMHHAYVNSAAYRAAGITNETPDPPGSGAFLKDEQGQLNGVIYEVSALQSILQAIPRPPQAAIELLLSLQYAEYAKAGFTTIAVLGPADTSGYPLDFMSRISSSGNTPIRTAVYALPDQVDRSRWPVGYGDSRFQLKGVKLYMDGSPYTGGAAFAEPYLNTPLTLERMGLDRDHRGEINYQYGELVDVITRYHTDGHQIAIHVQGETAIDRVLDAFAEVLAEYPRADHRHRLEHNALITWKQLHRAKLLGLTPSFFVDHIYFYGRGLHQIVGAERAARFMPIASAIRAGHIPSIHTDNPATPIGPFRAIRTAVMRTMREGGGVLGADERISVYDALKAVTINAAWQIFEEKERGSLDVGKLADLVLISENPLEIDPDRLDQIEVLDTWLGGEKVSLSPWTWTNLKLGVRLTWEFIKGKVTSLLPS